MGLSPELHARLGLGLPELQGAQPFRTHPRGTAVQGGWWICPRPQVSCWREQARGYSTQATRSPKTTRALFFAVNLLPLLQTGLNWIDEHGTSSLVQKMIFPSTQLFLSNFFQEVSSRFPLIDIDIKISWVLIAPLFITNKMLIYWDGSGSFIVNEL